MLRQLRSVSYNDGQRNLPHIRCLFQEKTGLVSTNFINFYLHTVEFSQCIPVIPSRGSTVFGLNLFSLSSLLQFQHLYIRLHGKPGDYNDWIFHFPGKPDLLLGTLNNTESFEYKLAKRT